MSRKTTSKSTSKTTGRSPTSASKASGRKSAASNAATADALARMPPPASIAPEPPSTRISVTSAVASGAAPKANTVVYIHGISNKPVASILKCQWDNALFGVELGDRSRMAYWVNRAYYPEPEVASCAGSDLVVTDEQAATTSSITALADTAEVEEAQNKAVEREIDTLAETPEQNAFLKRIAARMKTVETDVPSGTQVAEVDTKILPLPGPLRLIVARQLTRVFLRDVNDFLFDADRRKAMTDSLAERLSAGGDPFVVVAHSQGTMIAYEVLRHLDPAKFQVPLFVTIGSPLGMQEVQDVFKQWTGKKRLEPPACVAKWVNVAAYLDPVAIDPTLKNEFSNSTKITDHRVWNPDAPRHPHSGTGYLSTKPVRAAVRETLGNTFNQSISQFVISRDLAATLEDARPEITIDALIQLKTPTDGSAAEARDLSTLGHTLVDEIKKMIAARPPALDGNASYPMPERLKRFVAAKLTRNEIEVLRTRHKDLKISHIWSDSVKSALIYKSTHTVQAHPANLGYGARGKDIGWAVLDTGIHADHPHFAKYRNVAQQWDCTKSGNPVKHDPDSEEWNKLDGHGHGTHVAAIIAGSYEVSEKGTDGKLKPDKLKMDGMAPEARLYGFKVLDDNGHGQDSWIIKALDLIADLNESSSSPIIQGVNLSLGGNFDPRVYGVGHTPLCQELRRLWRQGVVVCLAAGNEGWALVQEQSGLAPTNRDISIGDPANLEEAIAVGSVHRENPHTYGISYFSSRGPTADGRQKPDVVAPGERIISALNRWTLGGDDPLLEDLYVEMSGTSMATPHVSGVLAAFLSIRREFIGYPDRVKAMLMKACTDLARDRYMQGAGLPNLIRMLSDN